MSKHQNEVFFELRRYNVKQDQLERWVKYMDDVIIPYQRSKGMIVVGSFSVPEENQYIWIRRFESEADRVQRYKETYETDYWVNEAKPLVDEMLDREKCMIITRLHPSALSIIR